MMGKRPTTAASSTAIILFLASLASVSSAFNLGLYSDIHFKGKFISTTVNHAKCSPLSSEWKLAVSSLNISEPNCAILWFGPSCNGPWVQITETTEDFTKLPIAAFPNKRWNDMAESVSDCEYLTIKQNIAEEIVQSLFTSAGESQDGLDLNKLESLFIEMKIEQINATKSAIVNPRVESTESVMVLIYL
jgi:hypothetical protein